MADLISRQAAIDALDEIESEIANGYGYQYPKWRKYFCELPSAQPEPCGDTGILDRFSIYQIEWLRSHNDIEFVPDEEDLIVRFLNDTLHCFKLEHQEKVDTPTVDTPTCEDAVSRQAVYNVLDKMPVRGFKKDGETIHGLISLSQVNSAIIDLPSVQPELLDEWCTDCKEYDHKRHCCPRWNRVIRQTLKDAQPEIIHCGECKHRDPEDHKCDCGHDIIWQLPRDDKWYCADAERRTDDLGGISK